MHEIAEIVIPPKADVEESIKQVMEGFCEPIYDDAGDDTGKKDHADWWDFYVIGGRFSGHKMESRIGQKKLDQFYEALDERKVTVSGFQCGKPQLQPASQIPMVDKLWREMVPGFGDVCPLFSHARSQYGKDGIYADDICLVCELPPELECSRLIIAGQHWKNPEVLEAKFMLVTEFWNRVEFQNTDFDGNVVRGIQRCVDKQKERSKDKTATDYSQWQVVTVDYHN